MLHPGPSVYWKKKTFKSTKSLGTFPLPGSVFVDNKSRQVAFSTVLKQVRGLMVPANNNQPTTNNNNHNQTPKKTMLKWQADKHDFHEQHLPKIGPVYAKGCGFLGSGGTFWSHHRSDLKRLPGSHGKRRRPDENNSSIQGSLLGCSRKLGSMVIRSIGYFTDPYKWEKHWGEKKPLILTIDPKFQQDIQVPQLILWKIQKKSLGRFFWFGEAAKNYTFLKIKMDTQKGWALEKVTPVSKMALFWYLFVFLFLKFQWFLSDCNWRLSGEWASNLDVPGS